MSDERVKAAQAVADATGVPFDDLLHLSPGYQVIPEHLSHDELVRIEAVKIANEHAQTGNATYVVAEAAIIEKYIKEGTQPK
jgi:hypothetical protein